MVKVTALKLGNSSLKNPNKVLFASVTSPPIISTPYSMFNNSDTLIEPIVPALSLE